MQEFWFYIKLGFWHVLDILAYDHILFLVALTIPFTFKRWKTILLLATLFTVAHCTSLALSVYEVLVMNTGLVEFLIPITIWLTAIFNIIYVSPLARKGGIVLHLIAASFFGLIHGFGFSKYFIMLMSEEEDKLTPLLGFATGIELSQVVIILMVLFFAHLLQSILGLRRSLIIVGSSILILLITIPMLIETFPW